MMLSPPARALFEQDMIAAPCTREAIEAVFNKHYGPTPGVPYPDEWYADKDNRWAGHPTGHLRWENKRMVWVRD